MLCHFFKFQGHCALIVLDIYFIFRRISILLPTYWVRFTFCITIEDIRYIIIQLLLNKLEKDVLKSKIECVALVVSSGIVGKIFGGEGY